MLKFEDDLRHYIIMTKNRLNRHYKKSRSHFCVAPNYLFKFNVTFSTSSDLCKYKI